MTYRTSRSAALLPATQALFDRKTVSFRDILKYEPKGVRTVQVLKQDRWEQKPRYIYTMSYGDASDDFERWMLPFEAHHDQTGQKFGRFEVEAVVVIEDGKMGAMKGSFTPTKKSPVWVYK